MKILFCHKFISTRGGEEQVLYRAKELLESKGYQVILFTKDNKDIDNYNLIQKAKMQVIEEAGSILSIDSTDANLSVMIARWRLYVWKDIINETLERPILGWGFGKKFVPPTIKALGWGGSWQETDKGFQDPHNSFLSIFHHTGIVGLFTFVFIVFTFFRHFLRFLRKVGDEKIKMLMMACLVSIVYVLGTSFFMVVLEGPYLGISLWFLMGLCVSLENIYRKSLVRQNENS